MDKQETAQTVQRLTALWALNEAALGGVLYLFKIPFTGLVIGGSSVLIIILMAGMVPKPGTIFRAMVLVIVVKGLVSPHTPVNAYAAVFLQGMLGELLFRLFSYRLGAFILAILAMLFSALQKFLVITLVFGLTFWESLDHFSDYVARQWLALPAGHMDFQLSTALIGLYATVHLLAGIYVGIKGPLLFKRITDNGFVHSTQNKQSQPWSEFTVPAKKHRGFFKRVSGWLVFLLAGVIALSSYIFPEMGSAPGSAALFMLLRSIVIMFLWYKLIAPLAKSGLKKFIKNKKHEYARDVQSIIDLFPELKYAVRESWQAAKPTPWYKRLNAFAFQLLLRVF